MRLSAREMWLIKAHRYYFSFVNIVLRYTLRTLQPMRAKCSHWLQRPIVVSDKRLARYIVGHTRAMYMGHEERANCKWNQV